MIYGLVVTFNPDHEKLRCLINSLKKANVIPFVIDNASVDFFNPLCDFVRLDKNYGIAKAQNIGIEYALSHAATVIVFFDQDSSISDPEFINELYGPIKNGQTKISAPVFVDSVRGFIYPIVDIAKDGRRKKYYLTKDNKPIEVSNVISSGTMVDINALIDIGYMVDALFIDYVDTEWCLRAYDKGYSITVIPTARMIHSIGDRSIKLGMFYVPKHSPFRRYYRIRNTFYLLRQNHIPKLMASREIVFAIIHQLILIFFSAGERLAYINSLFRGMRDGIIGRFK